MQDRVRQLFGQLRSSSEKDDFAKLDAGGSLDEVQRNVLQVAMKAIERVDAEDLPLGFVQPW